jgi:uncharacterized membrane protein
VSERSRFLLATLCGLVLAVAVHIVIILAAPGFAAQDAFSRLQDTLAADSAQVVSAPGGAATWMPQPDPAFAVAACAFDLQDGPMRVSARTGPLFQSLSFHSKGGTVFYALTDRAAVRGELELVVMTPRQLDEALAMEDENDPSRDVRILTPQREGFVIVRVAAPLPSLRAEAEATAKAVSCVIDGQGEGEG